MFITDCPMTGLEVLVVDDHVLSRHGTAHGTTVAFRCSCGSRAVYLVGPAPTSGRLVSHDTRAAAA